MSNTSEQELQPRHEGSDSGSGQPFDTAGSRPAGEHAYSSRRAYVLIACSVSQLPIWGFAMTYGILSEYYLNHWTYSGSPDAAGIIGTTTNGIMYLSMPLLFAALSRRWAHLRRITAIAGVVLACLGFLLSSFSTASWQLVLTQGVIAALGCALIYSPTTLSLSENYSSGNRALALGITLSCKNITGSTCPFLLDYLLGRYGFRITMWVWTAVVFLSGLACVIHMPMHPPGVTPSASDYRPRRIPWSFLTHRDIYIYAVATLLQSSGYGLPQTYLPTYARSAAHLSGTSSTLLLVLFNLPGILSSSFFGLLSDNKRVPLSATTTTAVSAVCAALAAFFLWGLAAPTQDSLGLLIVFSMCYGFMAGGYSATWGGILKEMEADAGRRNEAIDSGVVYGLLNGARGIGYVTGGFAGVQLLKVGSTVSGSVTAAAKNGYATSYGPVILYTGLATAFGGWGIAFKCWGAAKRLLAH